MAELAGRTAVVTGGGSGLGATLARMFAGAGMEVAVLDIDEEAAASVAASTYPRDAATVRTASTSATPTRWLAAAEHVRADPRCLPRAVLQRRRAAVRRVRRADRAGLAVGARRQRARDGAHRARVPPDAARRDAGSAASCSPRRRACSRRRCAWRRYQTSKFAVMGFAESLREELAPEGIGVTVLFPGGDDDRPPREQRPGAADRARGVERSIRPTSRRCSRTSRSATATSRPPSTRSATSLADLEAGEPYVMTHGYHRPIYERRRAAMDAAFDRMEAS